MSHSGGGAEALWLKQLKGDRAPRTFRGSNSRDNSHWDNNTDRIRQAVACGAQNSGLGWKNLSQADTEITIDNDR